MTKRFNLQHGQVSELHHLFCIALGYSIFFGGHPVDRYVRLFLTILYKFIDQVISVNIKEVFYCRFIFAKIILYYVMRGIKYIYTLFINVTSIVLIQGIVRSSGGSGTVLLGAILY